MPLTSQPRLSDSSQRTTYFSSIDLSFSMYPFMVRCVGLSFVAIANDAPAVMNLPPDKVNFSRRHPLEGKGGLSQA